MNEPTVLFFILISLFGSMFFSGSETGVLSVNEDKIRRKATGGSRRAKQLLKLLSEKDILLGTLLVGNNLTIVSASALTTFLVAKYSSGWVPQISTAILTPIILVFGEIIPKAIYLSRGSGLLLISTEILSVFVLLFSPLVKIIVLIPRCITKNQSGSSQELTRNDMFFLTRTGISAREISLQERTMIQNVLKFSSRKVQEAMIPLVDVISISHDSTLEEAADLLSRKGISRLTVYRENERNIVGILFAVDLFESADSVLCVADLMREPHYVPENKKISELFPLIWNSYEIAVVVDEYGVSAGIITSEDLVEEIVGEIRDEYDWEESPKIQILTEGIFIVDTGINVEELNDNIGSEIPNGDYITMAGFLTFYTQRIPGRGEKIIYQNMEITILEATPQRLEKIIIKTRNNLLI